MGPNARRITIVLLVALHLVLLAAYTLPSDLVPDRLRVLSQRVIRPLFHQEWLLFAPDPPLCSAEIRAVFPSGEQRSIVPPDGHYLRKRMGRALADHVQVDVARGDTVLLRILQDATRSMARDLTRDREPLKFVLVEQCVVDLAHHETRVERITALGMAP